MLELKDIVKQYPAGDKPVEALRGVDLKFRQNEFVSILGPSGCGKTTLLNIVGGLDQYTTGDLIINGKPTKGFNDRDWDTYRNHSIGFVFQNYHLIPHQTVLQNVEIALTVSGVNKVERRERAIAALADVGLDDQLNKRPNQISGGQMQRVAIARALVNDPEIILADEPTGALDTETGMQVMEILKEIAKDRLVIMVTHNSDLANKYSTRIIKMLDGKITSDSSPPQDPLVLKPAKTGKMPSMSFPTAFMLSLKNLFTKKGRTLLTAFAGSIGIMGIALILAVSQGTTNYIDAVQEDALSSYPLSIEEEALDISSLMNTFMHIAESKTEHENDAVYKKDAIYNMMTAINSVESQENDLKSFKEFLENEVTDPEKELSAAVTGLQYSYDLDLNTYTKNSDGNIIKSDTRELLQKLMSEHFRGNVASSSSGAASSSPFPMGGSGISSGMGSLNIGMGSTGLWQEILPGLYGEPVNEVVKKQYDLVYGTWPENYDEIIVVLDKNNELTDLTLYALGFETKENMDAIMKAALDDKEVSKNDKKWTYQEVVDAEYKVILNSSSYVYDEMTGQYQDLRKTDAGLRYLYDDALTLKVTGIIRPNESAQSTILGGSIGYTEGLTKHVIEMSKESKVVLAQLESESVDVLNGLPFKASTDELTVEEKNAELQNYLNSLDQNGRAESYIKMKSIPSDEEVEQRVSHTMANYDRAAMETMMVQGLTQSMSVSEEDIKGYVAAMSDSEIEELFASSISEQFKTQYAEGVQAQMSQMAPEQLVFLLEQEVGQLTEEQTEAYYDFIIEFSTGSYETNLKRMGYIDLDTPQNIRIFASSFKSKDVIEETIANYNENQPELSKIKYTDYLGIIMSSVTNIINAITYVLLAFVAISLIVSSIMIGVITLISVQERTKEIGILRAIGASKGDVSSMFNAETVIIGFTSGLLGVVVTYLLCIPINIILKNVTNISNLSAYLPPKAAAILIAISIGLSLISGFIPARSAAKKDPVVALRTE